MGASYSKTRRALATNSTTTSFDDVLDHTATKPVASATRAVINLLDRDLGVARGVYVPKYMRLQPFGTSAADQTFLMRVIGWHHESTVGNIWIPTVFLTLTCTLSAQTANGDASNLLCDTLVATRGSVGQNGELTSPASDEPALAICHTRGFELIELDFDRNSSAASCNCYYSFMDQ